MNHIIEQIKSEIPSYIKIVAVTKGIPETEIIKLIEQGQIYFGESKVQETKEKWLELKDKYPQIKLHLIGHLQTNKVKDALELFDIIETIDSFKLAKKIASMIKKVGKHQEFLIQVNIGNEAQKKGIAIEEAPQLISFCRNELYLNIKGLMAIAPINVNPKPYFLKLKTMADELNLKEVSMGMSDDYKEAICCGATQIRLGRILFLSYLINKNSLSEESSLL